MVRTSACTVASGAGTMKRYRTSMVYVAVMKERDKMIPQELTKENIWCVWRREEKGGKPTKIPYNPLTGNRAETNNPETFGAFDVAEEAYMIGSEYNGVGILLANGYCAVDIDHCCQDGIVSDLAMQIIQTLQSYTEYSPSGTGLRIIFKADNYQYDKAKHYLKNPHNGVEVYMCGITNRFVTITGNTAYGYPIRDVSNELQSVLDTYMLRPIKKGKSSSTDQERMELSDEQVIAKASARSDKFRRLFAEGDMTDYNNDHSSADLALCNMLAFWTGCDKAQMDRIFRKSALYREEKWGRRDDYSHHTLEMAVADCTEVYNPQKVSGIWERLGMPPMQTEDWTVDASGVWLEVPGKRKGDPPTVKNIMSTPVFPAAYIENTSSGVRKVELRFLYNGVQHTVLCDKETIASKTKILSLANAGIAVNSNNVTNVVQYLADMERINGNIIPHYKSVSHVGWVGNDFLPYSDAVKFDGEAENRELYAAITQNGDYDAWVTFTRQLRSNIYMRMMMAASFASPLLERLNALPFVFHLWGGTGRGKTVALKVAMSIWGNPGEGALTRTMNMTNAAMMSTVAVLRNLPFGGDELQTIKTNDMKYDKLIMQITEGIERGRMQYNRNLPTRKWSCAFLFTGEERCTNEFSGGGTKNRVIEVEADGDIVTDGGRIVNFITDHYGHAGKHFIAYIQDKQLNKAYYALYDQIVEQCDTTPKQAASMAILMLGDQLAGECIYPGEEPLTIRDVAPFLKSETEVDVATRAYNWVVDWATTNANKFRGGQYDESWGTMGGNNVFVIDSVLTKKLQDEGFSFDAVKKAWAANGWLIMYRNKYKKRKSINGMQPYCVELVLPGWGEEDAE